MSNPKLETQSDVDIKNKVRLFLQQDQWCKIHDLYERLYYVDWLCSNRDETKFWFSEFKRRSCEHHTYRDGTLLSMHKYIRLQEYARITGEASIFVVLFTDGLYFHPVLYDAIPNISFGGRSDRNIQGDVEPIVLIEPNEFKPITGWEEWRDEQDK